MDRKWPPVLSLVVFILVAAVLVAALVLLSRALTPMDEREMQLAAAAVYVVTATVFLVVLAVLFWKLLRLLWSAVARDSRLLGDEPRARVLGLGAVALVFPGPLARVVGGLVQFTLSLAATLPLTLEETWLRRSPNCHPTMGAECLAGGFFALLRTLGDALSSAVRGSGLDSLPWGSVAVMVALWVLATHLFGLGVPAEGVAQAGGWAGFLTAPGSRKGRQNALFFLILALGVFLSLAAISTIPGLDSEPEEVAADLSADSLAVRLKALLRPLPEPDTTHDPLASLAGLVEPRPRDRRTEARTGVPAGPGDTVPPTAAADTAPPPLRSDTITAPPYALNDIRSRMAWLREERSRRMDDHRRFLEELGELQTQALAQAQSTYGDTRGTRVWPREQAIHRREVTSWFTTAVGEIHAQAARSQNTLLAFDRPVKAWATGMREQLSSGWSDERHQILNNILMNALWDVEERPPVPVLNSVPERPRPGSGLGVFDRLSGWLLRTESLPLTLIVGMLGFGLLGAAASTFIRERGTEVRAVVRAAGGEAEQPIVTDLVGVVIRGCTAAIVVFLGVMGGLAMFGEGAEPDPYVLLFTCFAGAVFSERIWQWAEGVIKGRFQDDDPAAAAAARTAAGAAAGSTRLPPGSRTTTTQTTTVTTQTTAPGAAGGPDQPPPPDQPAPPDPSAVGGPGATQPPGEPREAKPDDAPGEERPEGGGAIG